MVCVADELDAAPVGGRVPRDRWPATSDGGEFTRQGARGSLYRLSHRSETMAGRQHATQFFALHETQSLIVGHVQLLGAWFDQDTGVALES